MNKETHIYLADKIYECLKPGFPVDLSLDLFREANIKPDQAYQSIIHPHFAAWSLEYIEKQTIQLARESLIIGEKVQSDFVICLGRITHYLCDFFCHVHIARNMLRVREHVEYETRLQNSIWENRHYYDTVCQMPAVLSAYPVNRMKQLYTQCLKGYLQQPAGFERDMKTATWISVQAASAVLDHCLQTTATSTVRLRCARSY